jgi:hypothetical protein
MQITVHGERCTWAFDVLGDPKHLPVWREDGLEVEEICNTIPMWVVNAGFTRLWCRVQDLLNFKF